MRRNNGDPLARALSPGGGEGTDAVGRLGASGGPRDSLSPTGGEGQGEGAIESRAQFLARTRAECLDEEQWLQEYCCQPCDDSTSFISFEMITACEADCLKDFAYLQQCANPLFLGFDAGRKHDLSVIDVGEKIGDV